MLGGVVALALLLLFTAIVAPLLFVDYWEYQIGLLATLLLIVVCIYRERDPASRARPRWSPQGDRIAYLDELLGDSAARLPDLHIGPDSAHRFFQPFYVPPLPEWGAMISTGRMEPSFLAKSAGARYMMAAWANDRVLA